MISLFFRRKEGRKEGRKEARKAGRNQGRNQGRREGRKEGRKEERKEARKQGNKEARKQGSKEARKQGSKEARPLPTPLHFWPGKLASRTPPPLACFKACDFFWNSSCEHCVCKWGGGWAPPSLNPPRFFEPCKLASRHFTLLKTIMRALSLHWGGGLRTPNPPAFLKPCKLASRHFTLFETHHASIVFANGGPKSLRIRAKSMLQRKAEQKLRRVRAKSINFLTLRKNAVLFKGSIGFS